MHTNTHIIQIICTDNSNSMKCETKMLKLAVKCHSSIEEQSLKMETNKKKPTRNRKLSAKCNKSETKLN